LDLDFFKACQQYISRRLLRTHKNKSSSVEQERVTPDLSQWVDIMNIPSPYVGQLLRAPEEVKVQMTKYRALSLSEWNGKGRKGTGRSSLSISRSVTDHDDQDNTSISGLINASGAGHILSADEVKQMMDSHEAVFKQCEASHRSTGVRWSAFTALTYYDPIAFCCIDVMHTIWLGVTKSYIECLLILGADGLNASKMKKIEAWIKQSFVPQDIGKMQSKWSGSLGHFKAIEWANFITLFALPAFVHAGLSYVYLLPLIPLQRLSFLLRKYTLSGTEIDEIELNIRLFSSLVCYVCGPSVVSINFHLLHHIPHLLRLYGPCCNWWCFPYERFNGLLKQYTRNESSVAASMMRSWINHQQSVDKFVSLRKQALETEKAIDQKYRSVCALDHDVNLHSHSGDQDVYSVLAFKMQYEEHNFETSCHIPTMPHHPSSLFFANKLNELVGGELVIDNDPLLDNQSLLNPSGVLRKVNPQGSYAGINYNLGFSFFFRLREMCSGSEYLATGSEPIPCLPKESDAQILRQSYRLDFQWSTARSGNLRALKAPPYIDQLTSKLLNEFYDSRYAMSFCTLQSQFIPSSSFHGKLPAPFLSPTTSSSNSRVPAAAGTTAFVRITTGDEVQCYRQMFICGELFSSRWSNTEHGFLSSLFEDKALGNSFPWVGQVCFFFSHVLSFQDVETKHVLPIKHHFAFVLWFSQAKSIAKGDQIRASPKDWGYPADALPKPILSSKPLSAHYPNPEQSMHMETETSVSGQDIQVTEEVKNKMKSKKDELKIFMQSSDSNALLFTKQLEDIVTDRLLQDFPLFEFHESHDILSRSVSSQSASDVASDSSFSHQPSFSFASILPLTRIWSRGCVANATKRNKIYINIPDKKHFQ
jgi:hypothetical protein